MISFFFGLSYPFYNEPVLLALLGKNYFFPQSYALGLSVGLGSVQTYIHIIYSFIH